MAAQPDNRTPSILVDILGLPGTEEAKVEAKVKETRMTKPE
jgi:hypothetical protein